MKKFWLWLYKYSAEKLTIQSKPRPTIAELEALLQRVDECEIVVLPDGSITTV